jgi:site-specific recombinase XerD
MELAQARKSWRIALRSSHRSDRTLEVYLLALDQLIEWLTDEGHSMEVTEITPNDIRLFIGYMLDTRSPATAKQRYSSLAVFFKWLLVEEAIESDPMEKVDKPKVRERQIDVVTESQFKALLGTCDGKFLGRRDEAIIRLLWDTGLRVSELTGLTIWDVSLDRELALVDGKTGEREAPFTKSTTWAIDRWNRIRSKHRNAHLDAMWLSDRGQGTTFTRSGVYRMLASRSTKAKIISINPHQFRHACADRLLSAGMNEGSVMDVMGWSDRSMLDRYGRSVRHKRAIEDYRRLVG